MIAYLDSSVVLRSILGQHGSFKNWTRVVEAVSSELLVVECRRVIDRLRLMGSIDDIQLGELRDSLQKVLGRVELRALAPAVLERAAQPFSSILGTLDALHLSTAIVWQRQYKKPIVLLTHDEQLALAARLEGVVTDG